MQPVDEPVAAPRPPVPEAVSIPTVAAAWRALERGRSAEAFDLATAALERAEEAGDVETLEALDGFAQAASRSAPPALVASAAILLRRIEDVKVAAAAEAPEAAEAPPAPAEAPPVALPPAATAPAPAPTAVGQPSPFRAWAERELTGSRLFALVGGTLMLLGIVFLFVVAAGRGWIGPGERVALGTAASLAVLIAGLALRYRYGRLQASLAAVGVGVAGAYATLAAATILYGFLPSWAALFVAAGIAAVGSAIALAWSSQLLAGLALVGGAVAPAAVALDEGISAPAPAFALIVLAGAVAAAAPRRWLWLAALVGTVAVAQVIWLVADSGSRDAGTLAVTAAAVLLLLAAGVAWQSTAPGEGLDPVSGTVVLFSAGLALAAVNAVLPADRDAGIALAAAAGVYGAVALGSGRRWRDLGWTVGGAGLLLGGVATADLLSGRSLSIAFAIEAAVLAGLAWRLCSPRFELGALVYLVLGVAHVGLVELEGAGDFGDVYRSAVPGLFSLSGAALAVALLLPARRGDPSSTGLAERLEPLWDGLVRNRPSIRATLAGLTVALAATGSAGLLSGRWLTILWAAAAAALGVGSFGARDRRLLAVALPVLALAIVHAWEVEAPLSTLTLDRTGDATAPIPSLLALCSASVVLALSSRFAHVGLRFLGPLAGPERTLAAFFERAEASLRSTLLNAGAIFAIWVAGLALIELSYDWGHVAATFLWAAFALLVVVRGAPGRRDYEIVGWALLAFALGKSGLFDSDAVGSTAASTSLLLVSGALIAGGFATRWLKPSGAKDLEFASLATAALAASTAIEALGNLAGEREQVFGATVLAVVAVLLGAAVPPFRRRATLTWARTLATGYWVLALLALLLSEAAFTGYGATRTLTLWAATAAALAIGWRSLHEPALWIAAGLLAIVSAVGTIALVTPPDRLVQASGHPGAGMSALLVCVIAGVALAWTSPPLAAGWRVWTAGGAAAAGVYFVSLAVLEVAERVSRASIETDFQRGHTAVSALLGLAALAIYVFALAHDHRPLRLAALTLFGLALAKLFLYDLSSLSSITRAFSFLALGAVLLTAGFFAERAVRGEHVPPGGRAGPTVA